MYFHSGLFVFYNVLYNNFIYAPQSTVAPAIESYQRTVINSQGVLQKTKYQLKLSAKFT